MGRTRTVTLLRLVSCLLWVVIFWGPLGQDAHAWLWDDSTLVEINGEKFAAQDYRNWWQEWQEEGMAVSDRPDEFIDWQLMALEGAKMRLDSEPSFQRKVEIFVKVRSLMILQSEEVISKIRVSRKELWDEYKQDFCPRWKIAVYFFETEALALGKGKALREGSLTGEQLGALAVKDGGPLFYEAKWLRYPRIKEDWLDALKGRQPGFITPPQVRGKYFMILHFLEEKEADEEDFATVRTGIEMKVRKRARQVRTAQFVEELKKKYQVEVNEEVLATIGTTPLDLENAERILVKIGQSTVSAGSLQTLMARDQQFKKQRQVAPDDEDILKKRVLASMLAQTLVSMEALNRHYEEKEPFKHVYQFYRKHRLTREIESRFIRPKAKLNEGEAKAYYDAHLQKYSQPEMMSYALFEGEEKLVKRIGHKVMMGEDFFEVTAKHYPGGLPLQKQPVSQLAEELKGTLMGLKKGEISRPFVMKEKYFGMVKLVNRWQPKPISFGHVKGQIEKKLVAEKIAASRKEFLDMIKKESVIKVNSRNWNKLRKELEKRHESKESK